MSNNYLAFQKKYHKILLQIYKKIGILVGNVPFTGLTARYNKKKNNLRGAFMIYLETFSFPTEDDEFAYLFPKTGKNVLTCYTSKYPFGLYSGRGFPDEIEFGDITIFCGNNGSGKSTLLRIMSGIFTTASSILPYPLKTPPTGSSPPWICSPPLWPPWAAPLRATGWASAQICSPILLPYWKPTAMIFLQRN